jgi:hypothetical protein
MAATEMESARIATIASQLRLRRGTPKNSTSARAVLPAAGQKSFSVRFAALEGAVVLTVSVETCAVFPLTITDAGERLHAGGSLAAAGVTAQVRFTVPLNPLLPATEMDAVFPVVAPGWMLIAPLGPPIAKLGAAVTVSDSEVYSITLPEVPVMVTVTGPPEVAVLVAEIVSTSVPAVVPAAKLPVTPAENPVAINVTVPENPPTSVIVMVVVAVAPWVTVTLAGEADSMKLGGTTTVS